MNERHTRDRERFEDARIKREGFEEAFSDALKETSKQLSPEDQKVLDAIIREVDRETPGTKPVDIRTRRKNPTEPK